MKPAARAMTAEEFARLPDEGMRQELVRGEVREMPPPGMRHGVIAHRVARALGNHVDERGLGFVFGEAGFHIEHDPDTVRAPDCGFVNAARVTGPVPSGYFKGAPDLAVEVLSPDDRPRRVSEKVASWLECGSRLVWVIDPDGRTVNVHRPHEPQRTLAGSDLLDGLDVLPGFRFPVADLFP
jgi:Uma2 family endonuclease